MAMGKTREEWIDIGERRILSILNKYTACTLKQFQLKISEAGPNNQRVEPILLDISGDNLFKKGQLDSKKMICKGNKVTVFHKISEDIVDVMDRVDKLQGWYTTYSEVVSDNSGKYCGNVLEHMIINAIRATGKYILFSNAYEDTPSGIIVAKSGNLSMYEDRYTDNPLDAIGIHKKSLTPIGIEIKNKIEWKYGGDSDIWNMIYKCCELNICPIFIARKVPHITKFFFNKAGILGMDTQFQFIHPSQKSKMEDIITKDKLGYAHIKFETEYRPFMEKYFDTVVDNHIEAYHKRFLENKAELYEYSKILKDDKLSTKKRTIVYKEIRDIIYDKYSGQGDEELLEEMFE